MTFCFLPLGDICRRQWELCRSSQKRTAGGRTSRETLQTVPVRLFLISRTHEYFLFAADETTARVLSISHFGCRSFISAAHPVHVIAVPGPSTHVMFLPNAHTSELLLLTWGWWPSTPGDLSGAEGVLLLTAVPAAQPTEQRLHHKSNSRGYTGAPQRLGPHLPQATSPTHLQTFPAATGEPLTDKIPLNVWLLSSISLENQLKMLFRDQTKPLIFSNLFSIGGNT